MEHGYIAPRPLSLWEQLKQLGRTHPTPGVNIVKGADGLRAMFLVTSNSYQDREREYITSKALGYYVDRAWLADDVCDTGNTLRFWHSAGEIGDIRWADMEGPFLIEVAKERPDALVNLAAEGEPERMGHIKAVWDYIESNPDNQTWGASHGFRFAEKTINVVDATATYDAITKFESSTLPLSAAANEITFSGVINMTDRSSLLDKIVGEEGAADKLRKGVQDATVVLDKAGVEHKAIDAPAEDKVKALLDKLGSEADSFISRIFDAPPAGLREGVMQLMIAAAGQPAEPAVDDTAGQPAAVDATGKAAKPAALPGSVQLVDELIRTQVEQSKELQDLGKAIKDLAPLNSLAGVIQRLDAKIEAQSKAVATIQAQLGARPKAASQAVETVENNAALLEGAQKQLASRDPFWGVEVVQSVPGAQ